MQPATDVSPRDSRFIDRRWFSPGWIDENEIGQLDHGEFQTPVWNCVSLAIASDRARDVAIGMPRDDTYIPGTAHNERGGDLRNLLECVERARVLEARMRRDTRRGTSTGISQREPGNRAIGKGRRLKSKSLATIGFVAAFVVGIRAKRSLGRLVA